MHVISKRLVKTKVSIPVYDLESPKNHNFVLGCGVVVHNSAKMARDRRFQEVLPLKGKIHNVMRKGKQDKALASDEVMGILVGVGFDPTAKEPVAKLRVGKLIFLCDADPDGGHINTLLLGLFAQLSPEVFERNKIYIAAPPEYAATYEGKRIYGSSTDEIMKKTGGKVKNIRHYKGLGEMDADVLSDTAFNPKTRRMYRVKKIGRDHMQEFRLLMEDDPVYRKKMLGI